MRVILAILILTATSAFAYAEITTTVGGNQNPTVLSLTCYAEKPELFGKYPIGKTEMTCIRWDKQRVEKHPFETLITGYDLKAYFQEKERIIFIFVPK